MQFRTLVFVTGLVGLIPFTVQATDVNLVDVVERFRAARTAGDYDTARDFLSDDPRVWYDSREGEGFPVKLGAGRYKNWDEHFNSHGELGSWIVEDQMVWSVVEEMNDYFRLLERKDMPRYRITYFFDDTGRIEGYMISAAYPGQPSAPSNDRFDEFEAWARLRHSEEWEYLRPGGKLDPTGDRAPRTRRLLEMWRAEIGLPPFERQEIDRNNPDSLKSGDSGRSTRWRTTDDPVSVHHAPVSPSCYMDVTAFRELDWHTSLWWK